MKKHQVRHWFSVSVLLPVLLLLSAENLFSQNSTQKFESIKGKPYIHSFIDKTDSLSSDVITELRDEMGIPLVFSRDLYLNVCLTGLCKMVRAKIYWTGTATYLGMQVPDNEPLTKTDHSNFKPEDYKRLDRILSDSTSVFRKLEIKDLTVETESKDNKLVDGHSGATEPSLSGYVVNDAVYTCYTLWHAVYGSTMEKIRSILEQRTDKDYLKLVFARNNPQYILWAIDFIKKHPQYHQVFYPEIMNFIKSDDNNLSKSALGYFTPSILTDTDLQNKLAKTMDEVSLERKFEIIWKFSSLQKVSTDIIVNLLEQYEDQELSTTMLGHVCEMIKPEYMEDIRIRSKIQNISKDENMYVRNITQRLLNNTKN